MSMAAQSSGVLRHIQQNWRKLIQFASWAFATSAAFVAPPPVDVSAGDDKAAVKFATLTIAFVVGLLLVPLRRFHNAKHTTMWAVLAVVCFAAGAASLLGYSSNRTRYTVDMAGTRVVIADRGHLTELGKSYVQRFPFVSEDEIVARTGGKPEWVWSEDAIHQNALRMNLLYVATVVSFAAAIIFLMQVWELAGGKKSAARAMRHKGS
ncbi:MAG TPA: hypothetical protein VLJ39_04925 [Tepidisphaeraceae bacterium]|nr:hypothetical protein [Tepidisphaeraceae bacterium]